MVVMVGVGERVIKTRTAAFVGCGVGGARDLIRMDALTALRRVTPLNSLAYVT